MPRRRPLHRMRKYRHLTRVPVKSAPVTHVLPALPEDFSAEQSLFPGAAPVSEHKLAEDLHDWILGGQDGLVNVLGTILGIAVVTTDRTIILAGGIAGLFAEALSMAAVAYTSVKASIAYYDSERLAQEKLIEENPFLQREILIDAYERRGLTRADAHRIVVELTRDKKVWLEMLMEEHLHLVKPDHITPLRSAFIVGTAATIGSLIPVIPFFFLSGWTAIFTATAVSALMLFLAGAGAAKLTVGNWKARGFELVVIGMIAALAGVGIGWAFTSGLISIG